MGLLRRSECPSRSDGPPTKRRDGASPSQSSPCNRMNNEELSFVADSQVSKAMNSSGACEAGKRTRGNWRPDVAAAYFITGGDLVSVSDLRRV